MFWELSTAGGSETRYESCEPGGGLDAHRTNSSLLVPYAFCHISTLHGDRLSSVKTTVTGSCRLKRRFIGCTTDYANAVIAPMRTPPSLRSS